MKHTHTHTNHMQNKTPPKQRIKLHSLHQVHGEGTRFAFEIFPDKTVMVQRMVNGWFGAFSNWDTPKNSNPFHKGIPGIQTTNWPLAEWSSFDKNENNVMSKWTSAHGEHQEINAKLSWFEYWKERNQPRCFNGQSSNWFRNQTTKNVRRKKLVNQVSPVNTLKVGCPNQHIPVHDHRLEAIHRSRHIRSCTTICLGCFVWGKWQI